MGDKQKTIKINEEEETTKNKAVWPSSSEEGELGIDLYETQDNLILQAIIGGVKASDLDITITNDMITIKGERQRSEEEKIEKFYYEECFWGPFSRSVILPQEINADKAKATIKNGLLTIILPKLEKTKKKIVEIEEE